MALLRTADGLKAYFENIFMAGDITPQQYNVLRILRGAGPEGLPTLTIAQGMIERTPGITGIIDRLETKGLVWREDCSKDRRRIYCRISKEGLSLLERLDGPVDKKNATFHGLNETELKELNRLLEKVLKVLESNEGVK